MGKAGKKLHSLTRIGNETERQALYRRDAHCPVMVYIRRARETQYFQIPGWLINISEEACLISGEDFPKRAYEAYVLFPGLGAKVNGQVKNQGEFTLTVEFNNELPTRVVDRISRTTVKNPD